MGQSTISGPLTVTNGPLTIGAAAMTEAQIEALNDLDATELAALNGITPGTAVASKAVVLGASKDIATITSATITTMTGNVTGNLTGYRVGAVSCTQSTISAAAGASNVATVTIQLKDGAGTNLTAVKEFTVYKSSASDGLTLGAAASTGFSVASGGLSLANGAAITTSLKGVTSATGGCVLSLTDTNKAAEYLVLVTADGIKISTVMTSGSYGA